MQPLVGTSGVNEWPAPTTRTRVDFCTVSASSASVAGVAHREGLAVCEPDQFFQGDATLVVPFEPVCAVVNKRISLVPKRPPVIQLAMQIA
jgi:hypothetical protein